MDKTAIRVDKAVLDNTTDCLFDFNCLSGEKNCLCTVVDSNEEDLVEIAPQPTIDCNYCISLDTASYCHCPTRVEIYKLYKK